MPPGHGDAGRNTCVRCSLSSTKGNALLGVGKTSVEVIVPKRRILVYQDPKAPPVQHALCHASAYKSEFCPEKSIGEVISPGFRHLKTNVTGSLLPATNNKTETKKQIKPIPSAAAGCLQIMEMPVATIASDASPRQRLGKESTSRLPPDHQ